MESKKIISKREFAKRLGVSYATVFNWINGRQKGIEDYLTAEGIDVSIFDVEPFKALSERHKPDQPPADQTEPTTDNQEPTEGATVTEPEQTEKHKQRRSRDELVTAYREQIRAQAETIKILQDQITEKDQQITTKDQQINALLAIQAAQTRAALPEPKQSIFDKIFRRKKPEQTTED